jgi:ADP-ribose pyrophosphatase YjhB (NUDIX family)
MYRKGVAAIILNDKNQILLVNLITFKEDCYSIPGGGKEQNEKILSL